ncbi:Sel1-repeat containing protein [Chondrus crispus]|uniref:Sel1-repeat containing protein n=1 Tax=Chondrus crispus TaxID=2769 RepID=R7QNQ1_CHOCR|nr:Sel1-repeat containing protein [Chondrus crispus]CDF38985.1 Sel1-repeat containing protein [Chondrus crispus]|eukprot:XP_005718890.1 Sel1-repeat containing protein [Chondrus crispus]
MINLARCLVPCEEDHVEEEAGRRNIARAVALLERAIRIGVEHSEAELLAIGIRPLTRKEYEGQARLKVEDAHDGEEDEEEEDDEDEYDEGERMTERLRESGITSGAHVVAMVMLAEILVMSSEPRESEKATRLLERAVSEVAVPNALEKVTVNFEMLRVLAEEGRDDAERCARVGRLCRLMMERSGRCEGAWVLGEMMRHGRGARQSARDAVHWFERGVSGGEARAAVALAEMLVEGEGDVPAERGRAVLLAAQAVAGGGLVAKRAVVVLARAWNARRGKG